MPQRSNSGTANVFCRLLIGFTKLDTNARALSSGEREIYGALESACRRLGMGILLTHCGRRFSLRLHCDLLSSSRLCSPEEELAISVTPRRRRCESSGLSREVDVQSHTSLARRTRATWAGEISTKLPNTRRLALCGATTETC